MTDLYADFTNPVRPMHPVNGTNNGPLMTFSDETDTFKELGIDYVRLHETHSPTAACCDNAFIFRDFDADENDPANYYFSETDAVITAAVKAGCGIIYRFGAGTESTRPMIFSNIPKDYAKWARICIHILMHYNDGWANGFHYNLQYCEIWNEAELFEYWPGELNEYTRFYCQVSRMLKEYDPNLRVGCCGWAHLYYHYPPVEMQGREFQKRQEVIQFFHDFLDDVKKDGAPLDFFAWHHYGDTSARTMYRYQEMRCLLKDHGLEDIESINTEWCCVSLHRDANGRWDRNQRNTMKSAIGCLASMMIFQKGGVSKAFYYDADSRSSFFGGLTSYDGTRRNHFHAFKTFRMLRDCETEVETGGDTDTVRLCAAGCETGRVIVVTNEAGDADVRLRLRGVESCRVRYWLYDETHKLVPMRVGHFCGRPIRLHMAAYSAVVCELLND